MYLILLMFGCAHVQLGGKVLPRESQEVNEAVLGWRLVPGQELNYAYDVRVFRREFEIGRTEHWNYLVKSVDDQGVAILEGRLTAFGALVLENGTAVSSADLVDVEEAEKKRLADVRVWVTLSSDGHVQAVDGLDWEDAFLHHQLGFALPRQAVQPGVRWKDPVTLIPLINLLPPEVAVLPKAEAVLEGFLNQDGQHFALIQTQGSIVAGDKDVPQLTVSTEVQWDLNAGALATRKTTATLQQYESPFGGLLIIEIRRTP